MDLTLSLKKSSDFQKLLKKGKWQNGSYLSIYIMSNCESTNFLGIAVSKKGINSVKRNRIKRIIKEAYRNLESKMKIGYHIVIVWKSKNDFEKATYENISTDMDNCFQKMNMIK